LAPAFAQHSSRAKFDESRLLKLLESCTAGTSYDITIRDCTTAIETIKAGGDAAKFFSEQLVQAISSRAMAYSFKPELDRALADYTETIRLQPDSDYFRYKRAEIYRMKGNMDGAIADFSEAIKLKPRDPGIFVARGNVYLLKRDFDHAVADYTEALQIYPNDSANYLTHRGEAYRVKGDLDRAIADYSAALAANQDWVLAYYDRSLARKAKGDMAGSNADMASATKRNPTIEADMAKGYVFTPFMAD
jgi:tetratricopeptide (TPR) repeat protein